MKKNTRRRPGGIRVEFQIAGEVWRQVSTLEGLGPTDHVFVTTTDSNGATTVQFGDGVEGAPLPTGTGQITATYRLPKSFAAFVVQRGRVILDDGWSEAGPGTGRFFGVYRGLVVNDVDPLSQRRVEVQMPAVLGSQAAWALPCGTATAPTIGSTVWVAFEAGDPSLPIWLGLAN